MCHCNLEVFVITCELLYPKVFESDNFVVEYYLYPCCGVCTGEQGQLPPPGYCAPYNGKICKHYLNGTGQVWFNVSDDNTGGWQNEQITTRLWTEMVVGLREPCRSAAEVLKICESHRQLETKLYSF